MPKSHSVIGSQRALIKRMGSQQQRRVVQVSFFIKGFIVYTAGSYTPGGDYSQIIVELALQHNVRPSDVILTISPGSILVTYQILAFTTERPDEIKIQQAVANVIQNYPNATGLSFVGGDISGSFTVTENGVTSSPIVLFTPSYQVTTFAGQPGNPDFVDGSGSVARFGQITSIAIDADNNTYVWDASNFYMRKIEPNGNVSSFTQLGIFMPISGGSPPLEYVDIAIARNSYVMYAIKQGGNVIYRVDRGGLEVVAFGDVNRYGIINGGIDVASFQNLTAIAVDNGGNIYVSQLQDSLIRKIDIITATVETYAIIPGSSPSQLTVDNNLDLYFIDVNKIRKINKNRVVTTLAGSGEFASVDGTGLNAKFNYLLGITYDSNNNLYVSESSENVIRKITNTGIVTTFAGDRTSGFTNGETALASKFNTPFGIVFNTDGNALICDRDNYTIRKIKFMSKTDVVIPPKLYGVITISTEFSRPAGIDIDSSDNVYVVDNDSKTLKKITPQGVITTIPVVFNPPVNGKTKFKSPLAIALDSARNMYVGDFNGSLLVKITPQGVITTIGDFHTRPVEYGNLTYALGGMAIDSADNIYVADMTYIGTTTGIYNTTTVIKKITPGGIITTLATGFGIPYQIALDSAGNIYVSDLNPGRIKKVTPQGVVSSIGPEFKGTIGIAVDSTGNIYVGDCESGSIKKITPQDVTTTIASGFGAAIGLAIDSVGDIYVSDIGNGSVKKIILIEPTYNESKASMIIQGLTLGSLTDIQKTAFSKGFTDKLKVNAELLTLQYKPVGLELDITINPSKMLTMSDNAFVLNALAVLRQLKNSDIVDIITNSNTSTVITGTPNIDHSRTTVTIDIYLEGIILSKYHQQPINHAIVGDDVNNCMYTLIKSNIVRITANGSSDIICSFPEDYIRNIFITLDSNYLVIPSVVTKPADSTYLASYVDKVYIVNISTKTVYTNITQIKFHRGEFGFNKFNNTIYYGSAEQSTYFIKYMSTIVFSNTTLNSIRSNIPGDTINNIIFSDATTGFANTRTSIIKVDLSSGASSYIVGRVNVSSNIGSWSNAVTSSGSNSWYNIEVYSPFADSLIGTNAFFTYIDSIIPDLVNNRILVADTYSQRIRSVDLRTGNNYAVTTLAGTSPIKYGVAINSSESNFTQELLNSLGQVGMWNNDISGMPPFEKVNSTYLTSTFNQPGKICLFGNKILVGDDADPRILSNGYVHRFIVIG